MLNPIELMKDVIANHENNPKWINAPLSDIKVLSNTHVGSVGEKFIQEWCRAHNMTWNPPLSIQSPWDIRIESITFEIKTATEDVNGNFQFNHLRPHREYDAVTVLGIAPDEILFDAWTKDDVVNGNAGRLVTMDKGSGATFKLTKKRSDLRPIALFDKIISILVDFIIS